MMTTQGKEAAIKALHDRRANPPPQIDNASLYAGSPMYYYCVSCSAIADVKPEGWFLSTPAKLCLECEALKVCGWLE